MQYLLSHIGMWLAGALALGLVVGFAAARRKPGFSPRDGWFWFGTYVIVLIAGVLVAYAKAVKGAAGLWVETLVMLGIAYVIGCTVSALLRGRGANDGESELAAVLAGGARLAGASAPPAPAPVVVRAPPAVAAAVPLPASSPAIADQDTHAGSRPAGYVTAIGNKPDNLKLISGIGKQNERRLNELGIWHFAQIAAWSKDNIDWIGSFLAFPGRIEREHWVEQAKKLAAGETTDFARRAARGEVPTSSST
jgi:predicted flap endonuclease-1-like 5' DNA nuclease